MSEALRHSQRDHLYQSDATPDEQCEALRSGQVPVAVYGLGRTGLPLSIVYASVTGIVFGVEFDRERAHRINEGECPIAGEPRLPSLVKTATSAGALSVTTDAATVAEAASVHVVATSTGIRTDHAPDFSALRTTLRDIATGIDPGDLIIVESTVPPGTCAEIVRPILMAGSGLDADEFGVAACPTRASPGRMLREMRGSDPKIVGGVDAESTRAAALLYDELRITDVVTVPDSTVAECASVIESAYRDVTTALANELAKLSDELDTDVSCAIGAANTRSGCHIPEPSPGTGGYDLPDYPYYLINECATDTPLLSAARGINESMPEYLAHTLVREFSSMETHIEDAVVLLLGLSYEKDVADARKSPAIDLASTLTEFGATVVGVDPMLDDFSAFDDVYLASLEHVTEMAIDAVVLVTDHDEFEEFEWDAFDSPLVVLDGRDALDPASDRSLRAHHVSTLGQPSSS